MEESDLLEQIDGHLGSPNIAWLLGAGVSCDANVPLMYPLTNRVLAILEAEANPCLPLVQNLQKEVHDNCHIEHLLSHLGDYAALADRSKAGTTLIGGKSVTRKEIDDAHYSMVNAIAHTVRWGYSAAGKGGTPPERIGESGKAITNIVHHSSFVSACFHTARAGLHERRGPVRFFTTNYDTLLEDALALKRIRYWDGFEGGAVGYRSFRLGDGDAPGNYPAHVIKLHGSIDWHLADDDGRVFRVRYGDSYPGASQRVLIYPQSTKYLAAQRDPFSAQFELLRKVLTAGSDNTIAVCGYSFGDDHINQEMEIALARADSKSTLLAFCLETDGKLPACLEKWRRAPWGARVYVITNRGIYAGASPAAYEPSSGDLSWWSFAGVTSVLRSGAGSVL